MTNGEKLKQQLIDNISQLSYEELDDFLFDPDTEANIEYFCQNLCPDNNNMKECSDCRKHFIDWCNEPAE